MYRSLVIIDHLLLCSHASEVMDTAGWNTLIMRHSNLVAEAFKVLACSQSLPRKRPRLSS